MITKLFSGIVCSALAASVAFYNSEVVPGISSASSTLKAEYAKVTGVTQIASSNPLIEKLQEKELQRANEILEKAKNTGKDYDHFKCIQDLAANDADARKFAQQTGRPYNLNTTSEEVCPG